MVSVFSSMNCGETSDLSKLWVFLIQVWVHFGTPDITSSHYFSVHRKLKLQIKFPIETIIKTDTMEDVRGAKDGKGNIFFRSLQRQIRHISIYHIDSISMSPEKICYVEDFFSSMTFPSSQQPSHIIRVPISQALGLRLTPTTCHCHCRTYSWLVCLLVLSSSGTHALAFINVSCLP